MNFPGYDIIGLRRLRLWCGISKAYETLDVSRTCSSPVEMLFVVVLPFDCVCLEIFVCVLPDEAPGILANFSLCLRECGGGGAAP